MCRHVLWLICRNRSLGVKKRSNKTFFSQVVLCLLKKRKELYTKRKSVVLDECPACYLHIMAFFHKLNITKHVLPAHKCIAHPTQKSKNNAAVTSWMFLLPFLMLKRKWWDMTKRFMRIACISLWPCSRHWMMHAPVSSGQRRDAMPQLSAYAGAYHAACTTWERMKHALS